MKKMWVVILIVMSILVVLSGVIVGIWLQQEEITAGKLNFNDHMIEGVEVALCQPRSEKFLAPIFKWFGVKEGDSQRYAKLPFLTLFEHFGGKVVWENKTSADLIYEGKTYKLHLSKESSLEDENTFDLFTIPPGSTNYVCEKVENDVLLDDVTTVVVLNLMGINAQTDIDYEKSTVWVKTRE